MKKMKTTLTLLVLSLLAVSFVLPAVAAIDTGSGIGVEIETEDFAPMVWMCDNRVVEDDAVEWGRISSEDQTLLERINNYAFTGESISWRVLVMDKNGIEKISDVFVSVGSTQADGISSNPIEANCKLSSGTTIEESCNSRIL